MKTMITRENPDMTPIMKQSATAYVARIEGAEPFEERPKAVQERLLAQLTPIVWSALPEILAQVEKAREKQVQAADGFVIPDSLEGLL